MQTVAHGQEQYGYGYLDNTRLVTSMTASHGGVEKMTVTRQYDRLHRLVAVNTTPSGGPPLTFGYSYSMANQRIRTTLADDSSWAYGYDGLGQVKSGKRLWSDGAPVPGQQFEYAFDQIGNRTSTKAGGDDRGAALREASYTANRLNQYDDRQVPGGLDVVGIARADAAVEVEGTTSGVYRHAEYFHKALSLDNTSAPVWTTVEVEATWNSQTDTRAGHVWLPQTPESFDYDQDGNLTQDGRWTLTWDGENRLTRLVARTTTGPQQRIDFAYDWRGRRISKKVWNNTEGNGNPPVDLRFVYDGWNLLAILDAQSSILQSFVWGLDLSGTEQGAGGVGGLLAVVPAGATAHYAAYDGNGNVVALIQATDGTLSARYEYGPFGEPIRVSGPMAAANPIRWSTKYTDEETDLVYYGHRYYAASTGRWPSRDPIGEQGGFNHYNFLGNGSLHRIDMLGLSELSAEQYRAFGAGRIRAGVTGIDQLWRDTLNHYLRNDPETDCVWDCEDDMEEVIEAFYRILSDAEGAHTHGQGLTAGVHTGDGSALTHFFAGAEWEGALELGEIAQDVFELIGGRAGDWLSDTAYAYAGADFSDFFDTWSEATCRERVKYFTSGSISITGLLGPSPPANTKAGRDAFRSAFRQRLYARMLKPGVFPATPYGF